MNKRKTRPAPFLAAVTGREYDTTLLLRTVRNPNRSLSAPTNGRRNILHRFHMRNLRKSPRSKPEHGHPLFQPCTNRVRTQTEPRVQTESRM